MPIYHFWFATRSRKWLLQGEVAESAKRVLDRIATEKNIQLLEAEGIVDHVHLLLDCEDKQALSRALFLLKGGSSYQLGLLTQTSRWTRKHFISGQKGYGSKIVPDSLLQTTTRYIQTQWDRL